MYAAEERYLVCVCMWCVCVYVVCVCVCVCVCVYGVCVCVCGVCVCVCAYTHAVLMYVCICTVFLVFICLIHAVTEQRLSQQKSVPSSDPQSVKLRFMELEGQWAELSRKGCVSSADRWSVPWDSRGERMLNVDHMTHIRPSSVCADTRTYCACVRMYVLLDYWSICMCVAKVSSST